MRRLLMAEQWDQFARAALPINAPADQKREMRRAFYAGGQGIYYAVMRMMSPDADATDDDVAVLGDLLQELSDFADKVKRGEA